MGYVSKLYLSGIEILRLSLPVCLEVLSKLYLSGIEIITRMCFIKIEFTPNCTLVELKLGIVSQVFTTM